MPRVPYIAQGQLPAQSGIPRMSVQESGIPGQQVAQAGQVASQFGSELLSRQAKAQEYQDAVERARDIARFQETNEEDLRRASVSEDFSSIKTMQEFGGRMDKAYTEILQNHRGSQASKLQLQARLEAARGEITSKAGVLAAKARMDLVDRTIDKDLTTLAAVAGTGGAPIEELFARADGAISNFNMALSPERIDALKQGAREKITLSAVTSLLDAGAVNDAEAMLAKPGVDKYLPADKMRSLRTRIIVARNEEQKMMRAGMQKLIEFRNIMGRDPNEQERITLAGARQPEGRQTLSSKIAEYEKATGLKMTPQQIAKMAGAAGPEESGAFGGGLQGRALNIITEDAPAYAAGLLDPAQERRFEAAIGQYTQPIQSIDPTTGEPVMRRPELPVFAADALKQRGKPIPQSPTAAPMVQQTQTPAIPQQQQQNAPQPAAEGQPPSLPQGQTLWGMSENVTGPVSAIADIAGRTPLVGGNLPGGQMVQQRREAEALQRDLVRALQNNPRLSEGERQAIAKEVNIEPQVWDNPKAYRDRLIGIDDALARREADAVKTLQSPATTTVERQSAIQSLNAISNFRSNLGVPPLMKNAKDASQLPPGTMFRTPDGRVLRVPQKAAQ